MSEAGADARVTARERFIPVRKAELLDALIEHGALGSEAERVQFRQICRFLAAFITNISSSWKACATTISTSILRLIRMRA